MIAAARGDEQPMAKQPTVAHRFLPVATVRLDREYVNRCYGCSERPELASNVAVTLDLDGSGFQWCLCSRCTGRIAAGIHRARVEAGVDPTTPEAVERGLLQLVDSALRNGWDMHALASSLRVAAERTEGMHRRQHVLKLGSSDEPLTLGATMKVVDACCTSWDEATVDHLRARLAERFRVEPHKSCWHAALQHAHAAAACHNNGNARRARVRHGKALTLLAHLPWTLAERRARNT